jgi:hypothetical protein
MAVLPLPASSGTEGRQRSPPGADRARGCERPVSAPLIWSTPKGKVSAPASSLTSERKYDHVGRDCPVLAHDQLAVAQSATATSACRLRRSLPMCGRSRKTLYQVPWTEWVSVDPCIVLTPIVRAVERGDFRFRRTSPRSKDPNVWRCDP